MFNLIFDYLGVYVQVMLLCEQWMKLIVSNLSNVDIFGYKVQDFDFDVVLCYVQGLDVNGFMKIINEQYFVIGGGLNFFQIVKDGVQFSIDGNIVDLDVECVVYGCVVLEYCVLLSFVEFKVCFMFIVIMG